MSQEKEQPKKIDLESKFKDLDGNIVGMQMEVAVKDSATGELVQENGFPVTVTFNKHPDDALTLRRVLIVSLNKREQNEKITEDQSWKNFQLTRQIETSDRYIELDSKQKSDLLERVHKFQGAYIYGQVREIFG